MRGVWATPWPFLSTLALGRHPEKEKRWIKLELDGGAGACSLHRPHCPPHPKCAVAAPRTACLPVASSSHRHSCSARQGQLGPQFRLQYWSTEGSRERGVPGGCRGAWGGEGTIHLGLTCYTQVGPCLTLPQFALLWNGRQQVTLETEGPGGGSEPSFALAGSSPAPMGSWEPQPVLRPVGMEEGLGQAGPWAPGLGGWPALPEGSSSTRSLLQRQAASASGERPCAACTQSR